ncbi:TIGR02186 family protein [Rhizobium halophytocola]|uniref:Uncharacterized protein (TIGR02186 family) n=1 Tax=Rhizobium halophytocola TaxID=735519 RepID=A0ABS4E0B3_9HYPH|nr:TIGR02186 family protein [Rhizobium halophytocola]MBP1851375.1 uncharacterized protein (TIGR02186 family) [Rhizobium halophytocola]
MCRFLLALLMLCATVQIAAAQVPLPSGVTGVEGAEGLDIGTSTNEIAITSDFRGANLTVFGALTNTDQLLLAIGQYDVIVTLEGPREDATVRRKERLFGIWVNRRSMTFEAPPESYSLASTRLVSDIASPDLLNSVGVGIPHIPLTPIGYFAPDTNMTSFRDAYRRLSVASGLYQAENNGVRFVSSNLFKATLKLPANIPNGVHMVHAYLFKSGSFIAQKELPLRVIKTGLEDTISQAAHEKPLLYGLFAVVLAMLTGWSASVIFRKD